MASITSFIRNTPAASLRAYFNTSGIELPSALDWDAPEQDVVRPLLQTVDDMDDAARGRVVNLQTASGRCLMMPGKWPSTAS